MAAAREHILAHGWPYPADLPYVITEHKTSWHVTFELPESMVGGVPEVELDKKTLKVIWSYHTQ